MTTPTPVLAALGLAERLLCRLAASLLPWSQRSQHDAWTQGYREALQDVARRDRP